MRRIYREFADGRSQKANAKGLNAEAVPGPTGTAWLPSTIYGHASRGTGILNNSLYVGRLVWNRLRYLKNPDTGKRIPRPNPPGEWTTKEVPELRIIDDALWQAVKARQQATRSLQRTGGIVRARRPKYLFSGLTRCAECGGGFILSSHDRLICFRAHGQGTCSNRRSIKRQEVETRVLRAMRERFFDGAAFAAFCEGFAAELERLRREHLGQRVAARRELVTVKRDIKRLIDALKAGVQPASIKDELFALEARKEQLAKATSDTPPPAPALHPRMPECSVRRWRRSPPGWSMTSSATPRVRRSASSSNRS